MFTHKLSTFAEMKLKDIIAQKILMPFYEDNFKGYHCAT